MSLSNTSHGASMLQRTWIGKADVVPAGEARSFLNLLRFQLLTTIVFSPVTAAGNFAGLSEFLSPIFMDLHRRQ
jgi:hypothetical protein